MEIAAGSTKGEKIPDVRPWRFKKAGEIVLHLQNTTSKKSWLDSLILKE